MGVVINAIVSPAKAGFLVNFWWQAPDGKWMDIVEEMTDSMGKAQWRTDVGTYPAKFRASISAGQVIDGVKYGGYTSPEATLLDTQEVDLYLYPVAFEPEPIVAVISAILGIAIELVCLA